ncbi:MAG TPA: AMP-binding protein [Stellaceae bacterium]|nr:AMP-binding protein [Stellaceae bacterium]
MRDYRVAYRDFSLAALERETLQGSLAQGVNACVECCDRWADDGRVALEWSAGDFARETVSFRALKEASAQFANLLRSYGIGRGDTVAALLPRIPELLVVALGTWRAGAIYQPLFTAFGPRAIELRVTAAGGSGAKLIVADGANRPKLDDVPRCPPVLLIERGKTGPASFSAALAAQSTNFPPVMLKGDDPFIILFTSGTTGHPKGVRYPLRLLLPVAVYMRDGVDLRPSDRYWNVADPGWAYGMLYAVLGPLLLGYATTMYEGAFTVPSAVRLIAGQGITNLAAAPTVYRLMMAAGDDAVAPIAGQLRIASSAGEPLNPEVVRWAERVLGRPVHDHYGQTEMGMLVNNHHGLRQAVKPGSAGLAMPGYDLAILDQDLRPVPANTPGILAVNRPRSPLFTFTGYWRAETPSFQGDWYLTGDTMQQDADGHFFFVGRSDDVITSAGYRIGPFDVESVIMEHPAVAEVAVVGKPDPERTEIVKAFVVLRPGQRPSDTLAGELQTLVRTRLSLHAYPREVEFLPELPKTPSGKVQRFLLRQRDQISR